MSKQPTALGGGGKRRFARPDVAAVFNGYPKPMRERLMVIRALIFDVAAETEGVGKLEEVLRWGMPSYLTSQTKSGSTVRLGWSTTQPARYGVYFHCQTNLVSTFRRLYPRTFNYEAKRAIVFFEDEEIPVQELRHCISLALTYHHRKRRPMK